MPRLARARRWLAPMLALIGIVSSATPAAALLLWTLTATPQTATSGVATNFSLTATSLDLLTALGCLEVDLPESFDIVGASAGSASNGDAWEAVVFPNKVAVHSLSGGGRLELGQSITFVITAIPIQAGTWTWTNHAHRPQDCSGAEEIGEPLAVVVLPGLTPTPTPTPTPRPTPTPTPILPIDPLPTLPPIDPVPSLLPTLPPLRLPTPLPTTRPTESPTPSPSPTASPAENAAVTPGGTSGSPPDSAPGAAGGSNAEPVRLALSEPEGSEGAEGSRGGLGDVDLGPLGVIDGIGVWAIPGAIVGGPGLLVILWVLLQTGVALAWIPAVRRMRGKDAGRPGAFSGRRTVAP